MSCLRLYAAPLVVLVWALLALLDVTTDVLALRLVTFAGALVVSIHEGVARRGRRG